MPSILFLSLIKLIQAPIKIDHAEFQSDLAELTIEERKHILSKLSNLHTYKPFYQAGFN
jgi:hypothetical protein